MFNKKTYSLPVGKSDENRLNIQGRLCDPYTKDFRKNNLPDLKGKTVLDIGCGTGILSCYWADEVGPSGKVIAIDVSPEQLTIASENAKTLGLKNIEFIEFNAHDLDSMIENFDLIYCRFVLMHLQEQESLLKKFVNRLKLNGYLFCEEVTSYEAMFSDPDLPIFQLWKNLILKSPEIYGTDFFIGKRLNSLFLGLSLTQITSEIRQPIIYEEDDKGYFYLGFTESTKKKFVDKGLISLNEIDHIVDNMKASITGAPWVSTTAQYMQIVGRKSFV